MKKLKVVSTLLVFFCLLQSSMALAGDVKVGVIVPLTGPAASWGREIKDAAILSHDKLSAPLRSQIEILFEDDGFQATRTLSAAKKLISASNVDFLISFGGGPSGAISPLADKEGIPTFAITGAESVAASKKFVLRHWVAVDRQAKTVLEQLRKSDHSKVALIITENEPPRNFAREIKEMAPGFEVEVVFETSILPDDKDFRSLITRLSRLELDAIVTALLPGHLGTFAKQLRTLDSRIPLYGFSGSESRGEIEVAGNALEGLVYAISDPTDEFKSLYRNRYGRPPELAAANAYDIIQLIGEAVTNACCKPVEMNSYLHESNSFSGALGTYGLGRYNAFDIPAVLRMVKQGKFANHWSKSPVKHNERATNFDNSGAL